MAIPAETLASMPAELNELFNQACAARGNAYAPYSGCLVGAAVQTATGGRYAGCNVENASYGGTICAERIAIGTAVAAEGAPVITAIMVVTDAETPWPPCGLCRQVIAEFGPECTVYAANLQGTVVTTPFETLFPSAFLREHLGKG